MITFAPLFRALLSLAHRYDANEKLMPPQLRPPFYGMLMFQQAVRGGSRLMTTQGGLSEVKNGAGKVLKVWPLMDNSSKELR